MPNPSRTTHSTQRLRPLLRFDYDETNMSYTLRIDAPEVGYHLWDTTADRWIWSNDIDSDITARVFSSDGGRTWHAYTHMAGQVRRGRRYPSSSNAGALLRKIEDWAVRRFKVYQFQVTDASQLVRQGDGSARRTINGRLFPPGTDAILLTGADATPLVDVAWSQNITPIENGFQVRIIMGEGRETIVTSDHWMTALRVANQQFNNFVGLRHQVQVQLPSNHDRPRVGSHNFAQYIEQPALPAGWAEGWR